MAPGGSGGTQDEDAKHLLDRIGADVHKKAKEDALPYNNALKGILSNTIFSNNEKLDNRDVCQFDHTKHTNVTSGKSNPCYGRQGVRFSDTNGAECYWSRIKGSKDNTIGACAPFRRLHMCDRNLEEIYPDKIKKTENLLVDVLLAAKHEGEMITKNLKEYDNANYESKICTALARSFADIGDIIRGKDHFLGHKQRKINLENRLQTMFANILNDNTKELGKLTTEQLREYWWTLNRQEIWKAITCGAPDKAQYFRKTCSMGQSHVNDKCTCVSGDPPTYFDYVPQYLRWFEEWAEDFCRKKKKYVNIVKKFCRGDHGREKFCSFNGYDCEDTISKIGKYVIGNECTKCSVACRLYESWIKNQKKEFEKQKKKYLKEILNYGRKNLSTNNNNYKGYDELFYDKIKNGYSPVDNFLKFLNNDNQCKRITEQEGKIDFTNPDDDNGTFSRSTYCQRCPECGVVCGGNECTPRQENDEKCQKKSNKIREKQAKITNIEFLFNNKKGDDIVKKLNAFCYPSATATNKDKGIEEWQCSHYNDIDDECETKNNAEDHPKVMSFVDFLQFWVTHLLNDSIEWRKEISKYLNNNPSSKCDNRCKRYCRFFKKWVEQKKREWAQIKQHYTHETDFNGFNPYNTLETILEENFLGDIKKAYGNAEAIDRILNLKKEHEYNKDENIAKAIYAIDVLLEDELKEAEKCTEENPTFDPSKEPPGNDDPEDEEHEKPPERDNPCAEPNGSNTKHPAIVNQVTHAIQEDTHAEAGKRGLSKLKGNALEGKYLGSGEERKLKNICSITKDHSNCTKKLHEPCDGKDKSNMFDIKDGWKHGPSVNKTHEDVYMPPRREHFCTSNLEYLQTKGSPFCGKDSTFKVINDSFLGDVLLSAKSEAKFIIDKYKGGNSPDGFKDEETICRALRYSFADLGDIIKGTDLWDENEGEKRTQGHLKEFFQIILNKNPDIEEKYKKIEDKKHLHLREDWWEANRHQVWRAMQCELKNLKKSNGDCHYNSRGTPLDDYIPQRLRWMTEWAEWYCKMQKKEYEKLKEQCKECKAKGDSCNNISSECGKCKDQCKKYKMFVDIWKKQWINISNKYQILYLLAKIDARNVRPSVYFGYEKDKHFLKFFKEIRKENYGKKTYETAEGYVHQEVPHMECKTQNQFCEKKHGDTSSNGEDNTKYTFKQPPPEYKDACGCEGRNKPVSEKKGEDACTIVETLLINKGETDDIDGCNRKYKDPNYPGWDCKNNIDNGNVGACMPPRRQKLCLYYLKELNGETENDLREAFIKTAAAETFLSWHKYKKDKQNEKPSSNPDNELKGGTIPPEFLRSMIYTFGDYRDICMDTDISAKTDKSHVKGAIDNIGKVFSNNGAESRNGLKRDEWWNTYAEDIWKGMLCGLSHAGGGNKETLTTTYTYANVKFSDDKNAPTLEKFAQRPQFLRWFTEWGEDFCKEHKKELETLKGKCDKCDVQDGTCEKESECAECKTQCEEYKKWLKTWQENYKNQKERYNKVKGTREYYNDNDVSAEIQANEYLDKQLKNMTCTNGSTNENCDYMCMGNTSKQQKQASDNTDMPASLEYPPKEINGKCDCKDKQPEPEVSLVPEAPKQGDNACTTVENLFEGEGKTKLKEACALKYGRGKYSAWKCYTDASKPDDGAVCIPPRRQKLYLKYLQELTDGTSPEALRQAFIQSAAIETFFLWDRYKKIKEKEKLEEQARQNGELPFLNGDSVDGGEQNPQTQLKSGTIPTDFLRQMFYTLGDYKDILDGKNIVVDLLSGSSGSDKEMVEREKQIKESIDNYFNSGKGQPSEKKSPDGLTRHQWWEKYGEDIWDEMVCALTYEESGAIGGTPKQNDTMKTTLYDTNTAKEDGKYNYKTVVLKDENSGTQAKTNTPKTTLKDFVLRPTYFRYLEEWGETFCRGRKKRLEKIKEECTENGFGTKQKCSGYGEDCKDNLFNNHYTTFPDFYCHSCAKHCKLDINDIYAPRAPKYKTLIEVVLEPSGNNTTASGNNTTASGKNTPSDTQNDIQNDGIPSSKITDNEWNTLKDDFISQYLQSEQPNDVPNDYTSGDIPLNTQPNTLYFDKPEEKPFITSIHDRNLYTGEEYSYNVNMVNSMDDIPINRDNNPYSGIDLINDTLSGNKHIDIYDELLKRKENELFGTNYKKNTSNNSVAKNTNSDSIMNQLDLFHRWLDRHRDMCEKLKNDNERLAKLKEEWENETHSGNTHPSDSNKTLNTDVSIQIHMDNPKPINEFTNMDTILDDLEKYNEPYYDVQDDIYYDVNDDKASEDHINMDHNKMDNNNSDVPTKVQIEMNVINNQELLQNEYPISHM
ncbi:hypothetical protein PFFCH_05754 [Plasmodium falciparum FCH/4]|uniref:Erythrocyte membrane protein 1, PfEMP1 n=1 Tax=Plasmodium falciparum FCH/4 TaxID=1036724 RepID=A0A024VEV9_PLAFA|nr:hypothetical protein PFFCH_05754 [Plasmodium falciparum FCH/4]